MSLLIMDLDAQKEVLVKDADKPIIFVNDDQDNIRDTIEQHQNSQNSETSFLSNFTSNMDINYPVKDEPPSPPPYQDYQPYNNPMEIASAPQSLYPPNIYHDIYKVDQCTNNVFLNVSVPPSTDYLNSFNPLNQIPYTNMRNDIFPFGLSYASPYMIPNMYIPNDALNLSKIIPEEKPKRGRGRPRIHKPKEPKSMESERPPKEKRPVGRPRMKKSSEGNDSPSKRPVGRPRSKKNQEKSFQNEGENLSTPSSSSQDLLRTNHNFPIISPPINKEPENLVQFPESQDQTFTEKKKLRSIKSMVEFFDFNFTSDDQDFNSLRNKLGFPTKFPLLMNQLSWDPKASFSDIAKYGCLKCYMCFRYQYDFIVHECQDKELASFCPNCWTMYPHKPRKKRRRNQDNLFDEVPEKDRVPVHVCDSTILQCTVCNLQFVNSFDLLQHFNLHYF